MTLPSVAIVAYPQFDPFLVSIPYGIFSASLPDPLFSVSIVASDDKLQITNNIFSLKPTENFELLNNYDIIIIPGWHSLNEKPAIKFLSALVSAHNKGSIIAGLCFGSYVLAYAGLLDGKKASTHWLAESDFKRKFPKVKLSINSLYVDEDTVVTSAGASASIDCCLFLVRKFYGIKIANKIARILVIPSFRDGGQSQFSEISLCKVSQNGKINCVIDYIKSNLNKEFNIDELARMVSMSRRTFTRTFEKITGISIGKWIILQKVNSGCELLESTSLSIEEIAVAVGFNTSNLFRRHFNKYFKVSPRQWRKNFCNM